MRSDACHARGAGPVTSTSLEKEEWVPGTRGLEHWGRLGQLGENGGWGRQPLWGLERMWTGVM